MCARPASAKLPGVASRVCGGDHPLRCARVGLPRTGHPANVVALHVSPSRARLSFAGTARFRGKIVTGPKSSLFRCSAHAGNGRR